MGTQAIDKNSNPIEEKALNGVNISIKEFWFTWTNGAGKTTTINILTGLVLKKGFYKVFGKTQ